MSFIFDALFGGQGDFQPPSVGFFALVKNDLFLVVPDADPLFQVIFFVFKGKIMGPVVVSVDEIPDHLCHQVSGLAASIKLWIHLVKADGGQFVA